MPGTYGNKNAEKWTEEKALQLGEKLLAWLSKPIDYFYDDKGNPIKLKSANVFFKYFVATEGIYDDLFEVLIEKFESFATIIKKAKTIQEQKINELSINGVLNPTMSIFLLKNHHGYKDKTETDLTTSGQMIVPQVTIVPYQNLKSAHNEEENLLE